MSDTDKEPVDTSPVDALDGTTLDKIQQNKEQISATERAIKDTNKGIAAENEAVEPDKGELEILNNNLVLYTDRLERLHRRRDELKNRSLGKVTMPLIEAPDDVPLLEAVNPVAAITTPESKEQKIIVDFRDKNIKPVIPEQDTPDDPSTVVE